MPCSTRLIAVVACAWACALATAAEDAQAAPEYVRCGSSTGDVVIEVNREWAPKGAERFLTLVREGFYDGVALFRCIRGFLVQFGIPASPQEKWKQFTDVRIDDDPTQHRELKTGYLSYAGSGPNSRTTQVFITYGYPNSLGKAPWEVPFGRVVEGMEHVHAWNSDAGDKPNQLSYMRQGNKYIQENFPNMSYIKTCIVEDGPSTTAPVVIAQNDATTVPAAGDAAAHTVHLTQKSNTHLAAMDPKYIFLMASVIAVAAVALLRPALQKKGKGQ